MKVVVTSTGPTLDDTVEARFGRCPYFLVVDLNTLAFEAVENPNISQTSGAGTQSAQLMAEKGVSTVLTGNCGPKASQVFEATGIEVITGISGPVGEAVGKFKAGQIQQSSGGTPQNTPAAGRGTGMGCRKGMGSGRGMGMGGGGGMGGGRGMGMGGGGGMGGGRGMGGGKGMGGSSNRVVPPSTLDEASQLKQTAEKLRAELSAIEKKLADLSNKDK